MDFNEPGLDMEEVVLTGTLWGAHTSAFRIRGEEGITQGIFRGDIAVIDRTAAPRAHDLVLWHDGRRLKLSRPTHVPQGVAVQGTVTAVIRHYHEDL